MYYSKNCRKSKQLRENCIFQARNHNNGYKPTRRFLPSPEWTVPEKVSKSRRVTTGHVLGNMVVFPTTECLAGSCIGWRASVGWKAVFAGLRIVILRSVVFLPEHPERRLISETGQGIAVCWIVSISRNRAGTVPGHC